MNTPQLKIDITRYNIGVELLTYSSILLKIYRQNEKEQKIQNEVLVRNIKYMIYLVNKYIELIK